MLILNFSHPLTKEQRAQIEEWTGQTIDEVLRIPVQLDVNYPFDTQIAALAEACQLDPDEWQTRSILVVPPGLSAAAATLMAELHGRMGYFPPVVRLKREGTPPRFVVAEIIDLQAQREKARQQR